MIAEYFRRLKCHFFVPLLFVLFCSCREDEPVSKNISDEVPGLSAFGFLAKDNPVLFQDILFTKQEDNSYLANVVHEVELKNIRPAFEYDGQVRMEGQNFKSGSTAADFSDQFTLQFDSKKVIFHVNRYYAIPSMHINTINGSGVTSRTEYVKCTVQIDGKNLFEDFVSEAADSARIRARGNSTWVYYEKKPYRLKLGSKEAVLGMKPGKDWVLLANYRDPTHFMNAVAFDMARYMQMPFTNSNRFVELYLDNEYVGMYQFTEQIEQGTNRVDIDDDAGVLLNLDLDDGPRYSPASGDNFYSSVYELPIGIKYPEDLSSDQIAAIKADFAELETLIENRDMTTLSGRLDLGSMIDFLIIQEMTRNVELVSPRSMYLYKDADNVYRFGPAWDFDGGFSFDWASMKTGHNYFGSQSWLMGGTNPSLHPPSAYNYIPDFFVHLFGNAQFVSAYKNRWAEIHAGMLDYCFERLDDYTVHCDSAMMNNAKRWPIGKDHKTEIEKMKSWLTMRANSYSDVVKKY